MADARTASQHQIATGKTMWRNLLLGAVSFCVVLGALEIYFRLRPPTDLQTNNEYAYRERTGAKRFGVPYHTWQERFPAELDERGYYARSNYAVGYHFNQLGARWIETADQPIAGTVIVVLGDSFTYGSGLRYEDGYVYRVQQRMRRDGFDVTLVNFAESGADAVRCLEIYRSVAPRIHHSMLLYGLHLNDLISFGTSFVIRNQVLDTPIARHSRLAEFLFKRVNRSLGRRLKIRHLTSPGVFETATFARNMDAITELSKRTGASQISFGVVLLPVLVDVREDTFRPVYARIAAELEQRGIEVFDLSGSVRARRDAELWILPVDQHPNEIANAIFADQLGEPLERNLSSSR